MKVKLLTSTPDPLRLSFAQTRGTTTSKGFDAVWDNPERFFPKSVREEMKARGAIHAYPPGIPGFIDVMAEREMKRLVTEALEAGHWSVMRGVSFTFSFEVSRSTSLQMLRHVVGVSWEQASQRYVKLLNSNLHHQMDWHWSEAYSDCTCTQEQADQAEADLISKMSMIFEIPRHVLEGHFTTRRDWFAVRLAEVSQYLQEIKHGIPAEDARENLPNCTKTQMIGTFSFEAVHNLMGKRLCTRAQQPFREVAKAMRKEILKEHDWLSRFMTPHCMPSFVCPEACPGNCPLLADHGGLVLRKEQAMEAVNAYRKQLALTEPRMP